jgi:nucleoside-diphosphate-sugar epimerase
MTDKVLLTGVSGWIAKHTAIELLNAGYEVLGTVRNNTLIEQTKETISQLALRVEWMEPEFRSSCLGGDY